MKLPFYKMYPAEAEIDENFRAMTDEELGFYWRCLNQAWLNKGLPANPDERCRTLRVDRKYHDRVWIRVGRCFVVGETPERLFNRRQEDERTKAQTKSESATKSVRSRYERSENVSTQERVALRASDFLLLTSDSKISSEGVQGEPPKQEKPKSAKTYEFALWVDRIYARHPKKRDKILAEHKLAQLFGNATTAGLAEFERVHAAWCATDAWRKSNGQFVPALATWLEDDGHKSAPRTAEDEFLETFNS